VLYVIVYILIVEKDL